MPFRPFFSPSSDLTNELMASMGKRRARVLRDATGQESAGASPESEELLRSFLAALEDEPEHSPEQDWEDQRWLGNIIYHLLGRMAGRAQRQGARQFRMTEAAIIEGMSTSLGLYESRDIPLLEELAADFSLWLSSEPNNSYPAGWGKIVHDPYEHDIFYLEPFEREDPATAPEIYVQPHDSGIPINVRGGARAANATGSRFVEIDSDT